MSFCRGLILYCLCLLPVQPLWAQRTVALPASDNYIFRSIDIEQGLNNKEVLGLTQDARGYMWIGTRKGLQRYDGLRFLNCLQHGNAEGDIGVIGIFPDDGHQRVLYMQNDYALYQWDIVSRTASLVKTNPTQVYKDDDGHAWLLQPYQQDLCFVKNGNDPVQCGHLLQQGPDLWLQTRHYGLRLVDTVHHLLYSQNHSPDKHPLLKALSETPAEIQDILLDHHGNIWLYSWAERFYRYETGPHVTHTYSLNDISRQQGLTPNIPSWVSSILEDNHGALWLGTAKTGLLQYDYAHDRFSYTRMQPNNSLALQYNHQINVLFQDRENNIWVGTDKGISIFNPYRTTFVRLQDDNTTAATQPDAEIDAYAQTPDGNIWVGSWGGGIRIYDSTFRFKQQLTFQGDPKQNQVWCLRVQPDGSVWAGCQGGFLHILNPKTFTASTLQPPTLPASTIRAMTADHAGHTLLGLQNGQVIVYDSTTQTFLPFQESHIKRSPVEFVLADGDTCWTTTLAGLQAFDIRQRRFVAMYHPGTPATARCMGIAKYNDSLLLLGTDVSGPYFFNKRRGTFTKLSVNDDHTFPSAYALRTDDKGNIWYTGDYYINCYNPQQQSYFSFRPEKGLLSDAFRADNFLVLRNGLWLVYSNREVLGFDPDMIRSSQPRGGQVSITGFRIYSNALPMDSLLQSTTPVTLQYQQNFITVEFSDLQYASTLQTKYYYRLDGVDKDWVYGGGRGYASYTNLAPGKYLFHVKARHGTADTEAATLEILIRAPFWATTWFRLLVGAVIILSAAGLIRWYIRGAQQEARMKQQLAQTEMMALRAQMNPHFIFNCINSIDALIQCDDKYLATTSLNKFAKLIRNILDSSQQHTTTLLRDLETLQLYIDLEQLRNEHAFTADINVEASLLEDDCKVPPLIIQPYVENAILHGLRNRRDDGGRLSISITRDGERLKYVIEDNGVGRAVARTRYHSHQSYGLEISRSRVELFNGETDNAVIIRDLYVNGRAAGTRVEVSLKYC